VTEDKKVRIRTMLAEAIHETGSAAYHVRLLAGNLGKPAGELMTRDAAYYLERAKEELLLLQKSMQEEIK
jgi:hypothetical protein